MLRLVILITLLTPLIPAYAAANPKFRPDTGRGLLVMHSFSSVQRARDGQIVLYREPGVARIGEIPPRRPPSLEGMVGGAPDETALAVLAKKREWVKIAYDDAGREGWIRMERSWRYVTWETFLKGRTARLLPGLRNGYSLLRGEAGETAPELGSIPRDERFRIIEIRGDWARVLVGLASLGWLRWRDTDGRLLLSVVTPASR